jgi:hypothetical protein
MPRNQSAAGDRVTDGVPVGATTIELDTDRPIGRTAE